MAATAALVAPAVPALEGLISRPLPPAELVARLARAGLDLVPRRPDAALLSRTCKVSPYSQTLDMSSPRGWRAPAWTWCRGAPMPLCCRAHVRYHPEP